MLAAAVHCGSLPNPIPRRRYYVFGLPFENHYLME